MPKFVQQVIQLIEGKMDNMKADGIYRASGNLSQIQKIRCQVWTLESILFIYDVSVVYESKAINFFISIWSNLVQYLFDVEDDF